MERFKKLGLSEHIVRVVEELKFTVPTEIQEKAIPLVLNGKDVIGTSATGSGKTLVFGAGIIQTAKRGRGVQALVLTPTRELAEQVTQALRAFSRHYGLVVQDVYGGVSISNQIDGLRRAEVVVGTPGRILDHLERRTLDLSRVQVLVLDEADRMVDMGFLPDVEQIIKKCPTHRQTMLFSATLSSDIDYIADQYMNNPVQVAGEQYVDPSKLRQFLYDVPSNAKFSLLVHLLKEDKSQGLVMVFCNTRRTADVVTQNLNRLGINAIAIHGGLTQNRRNTVMENFKDRHSRILVCTDVAARGLDIPNVSHIYNYDTPKTSIDYIHRIGRTARAGKEGEAISIVSERDYENLRKVESNRSLKIVEKQAPQFPRVPLDFGRGRGDHEERGRHEGGRGGFGRRSSFGGGPRQAHGPQHGTHGGSAHAQGAHGYGQRRQGQHSQHREHGGGSYGRGDGKERGHYGGHYSGRD